MGGQAGGRAGKQEGGQAVRPAPSMCRRRTAVCECMAAWGGVWCRGQRGPCRCCTGVCAHGRGRPALLVRWVECWAGEGGRGGVVVPGRRRESDGGSAALTPAPPPPHTLCIACGGGACRCASVPGPFHKALPSQRCGGPNGQAEGCGLHQALTCDYMRLTYTQMQPPLQLAGRTPPLHMRPCMCTAPRLSHWVQRPRPTCSTRPARSMKNDVWVQAPSMMP